LGFAPLIRAALSVAKGIYHPFCGEVGCSMGTYHTTRRDRSVNVGLKMPDLNWISHIPSAYADFGYYDWLLSMFKESIFIRTVDTDDLFGNLSGGIAPTSTEFPGLPPLRGAYTYLRDVDKYSNPIGTAFDLITNFDTQSPQNENSVFHTSFSGDYCVRKTPLYSYDLNERIDLGWGFSYLIEDQNYNHTHVLRFAPSYVDGLLRSPFVPYSLDPGHLGEEFHKICLQVENFMRSDAGQVSYVEDFVPAYSDSQLSYANPHPVRGFMSVGNYLAACGDFEHGVNSFSYTHYAASISVMRVTKVNMWFEVVYQSTERVSSSTGNLVYKVIMHCDIRVRWFTALSNYEESGYFGWYEIAGYNGQNSFTSETSSASSSVFVMSNDKAEPLKRPDLFNGNESRTLIEYDKLMRLNLAIFRPAAMFSYANAIEHFRALQGDYLEVAYQWEKIGNLTPDVLSLAAILLDAETDPILFVRKLLHFLAGLKLQYTFGTQKFVGNVEELTSAIDSAARAIDNISRRVTLHGKFTYRFASKRFGIDDITLVARTKVVAGGAHIDLFIKLLKLDSVGLSPRSSHLWDLIPFSWLVDFFTGLGSRLDVLDSVILGLMIDTQYCVHSFRISYPVPPSVLQTNNLDMIQDGEFVHYAREVSRVVPFIFHSEVDYGMPQYPPDAGIISALFFTLFGGVE